MDSQEVEILTSDLSDSHVTIEIPIADIHVDDQMKEEHLDQCFDNPEDDEIQELEIVKLKEPRNTSLNKNNSAKKRVSLTIEKKIEVIQRHEKGESQKMLATEFNVGRTTISDILKRKMKFFSFVAQNADKSENLKRRRTLRKTIHKVLEEKVMEWYNQLRDSGAYVSGPMIAQRAQELHKELGYTDNFTASNGWLDRFKVRNGIKLCGLREVRTESDTNAVAPFKAELESLAQWYNLSLEQIYNADETDLFYRMLPNPNDDMNEVKASVRVYRERMTVLCCTNATGSHKLPLVCIGRGKRSRTFTSNEIRSLPVQYYSQETAWMDSEIFKNWFHTHFIPSVRQHLSSQGLSENALLLIDRSPSHPEDQYLRSEDNLIFVQYFPAKVKSLIQPMEQGIIHNLKLHYRFDLLADLIAKNLTLPEFYKQFNIKDAIKLIAEGWNKITSSSIQKSFAKIFPAFLDVVPSENEAPSIDSFNELISKIPECVEKNYNQERLEFWLACDEAEPIKDRNTLTLFSFKDEQRMDDDDTMKIYDNYQDEVPQAIEVIASSDFKNNSSLDEEMISEETEIDILSQSQQEVIESMQLNKNSDDDFLYEESTNNDVTCEQAIDALDLVLNFMKNDSESRYRDVVFLSELKKKLRRRLSDFAEMKQEKGDFM